MTIFISYTHANSDIAERIGAELVRERKTVWIDKWELHVGDSLVAKIEEAIQASDALIVVLSKDSVNSQWCKQEFSSGLLRELEEKRVVVLPAVIEECELPLFLRGKKYADFRKDFDVGMRQILEAIAKVASEYQGRTEYGFTWHLDWAVDWGFIDDILVIELIAVEHGEQNPYAALTQVRLLTDGRTSRHYVRLEAEGLEWILIHKIVEMLGDIGEERSDLRLTLTDQHKKEIRFTVQGPHADSQFLVLTESRWLGHGTGRDVLLDVGGQLRCMRDSQSRSTRQPTEEEMARFRALVPNS